MPNDPRVLRELGGLLLLVAGVLGFLGGVIWLYVLSQGALATVLLGAVAGTVGWGLTRYDPGVIEPPDEE